MIFGVFFAELTVSAELLVAIPEVLAVGAAITHAYIALATIPVNLAVLIVLATPAAMPADFKKVSPFNFFNDQSHRHQVLFNLCCFHQLIEFINLIVSTIEVDDENFFCKYRQIFLSHIQSIPGWVRFCNYRQLLTFIGVILLIDFIVVQPSILHQSR